MPKPLAITRTAGSIMPSNKVKVPVEKREIVAGTEEMQPIPMVVTKSALWSVPVANFNMRVGCPPRHAD